MGGGEAVRSIVTGRGSGRFSAVALASGPLRPSAPATMRAMRTIDLSGQNALILGVANQRSIAWAVAEALNEAGARLAFTYQGERLEENVRELAARCPG